MLKILIALLLAMATIGSNCIFHYDSRDFHDDIFGDEEDEQDTIKPKDNPPVVVIGVRSSSEENAPRDLERMAAIKEQEILNAKADRISARFGLSAERGLELAKIYTFWRKKAALRTLSMEEQNQLSLKIVGTDVNTFTMAMRNAHNGDPELLDEVANKAALINGTSPEHMREILNDALVR